MKIFQSVLGMVVLSVAFLSCANEQQAENENINPEQELNIQKPQQTKAKKPSEMPKAETTSLGDGFKIYEHTEVDQKPIYSPACKTSEDAWECTVNSVKLFVQDNIVWPKEALKKGQDGYEEVTFVVMPNGEVGKIKHVVSKDEPCEGCQQAAVDVVSQLEEWEPGTKNGQPVAVKLTLPIRFTPL